MTEREASPTSKRKPRSRGYRAPFVKPAAEGETSLAVASETRPESAHGGVGQPPRLARDGTKRGIAAGRSRPALTPDVLDRILAHLAEGQHYDTACHLEGVWPTSLDEAANKRPDVAQRVAQARAQAEATVLRRHVKLSTEGERTGGTEWQLERSWPQHWAPAPQRTEVSGPNGGAQVIHHRLEVAAVQRLALSEGDNGE